jgi:hypothetical protein
VLDPNIALDLFFSPQQRSPFVATCTTDRGLGSARTPKRAFNTIVSHFSALVKDLFISSRFGYTTASLDLLSLGQPTAGGHIELNDSHTAAIHYVEELSARRPVLAHRQRNQRHGGKRGIKPWVIDRGRRFKKEYGPCWGQCSGGRR